MPSPVDIAEATADVYAAAIADAITAAAAPGAGDAGTVATESAFTSITSAVMLAANAARKKLMVNNNSDQDCFIRYGASAASTTTYTQKVPSGGTTWSDADWTGEVRGIMAAAITSGAVRVTELT